MRTWIHAWRSLGTGGVSVYRVAAGSHAAENGLKAGDLIIGVNRADISGLEDLKGLIARKPRQILLTVVRGGDAFFVPLR